MEELLGCWREARRADMVAAGLLRCRNILDLEFYDQISAVLREVESSSRLLRDLYDLFPIYRSRVPIVIYSLNLLLPSICKSMKEMTLYLEHESKYSFLACFSLLISIVLTELHVLATFGLSILPNMCCGK